MTKDIIIGCGFVGAALKTLLPDAKVISQKKGNIFPLVLIHKFLGYEELYPNSTIRECQLKYEEGYDTVEYFKKSRGGIPDYRKEERKPESFEFIDFDYKKYFWQKKYETAMVTGIDEKNREIKVNSEWRKFDRLFITVSMNNFGYYYHYETYKKLAIFKVTLYPIEVENTIFYFSSKDYTRIWNFNCNSLQGDYIEQPIPAILPNNTVLSCPILTGEFMGIFQGHVFGQFPEKRRKELEEQEIHLVGRQALCDYSRVDENIVDFKRRFKV